MKVKLLLCIVILPILASAFSPAVHMYIGSQTHDIWEDFDPDFYYILENSKETRKFYYIGLTLPDMFDYQDDIQNLLTQLNTGIDVPIPGGNWHLNFTGALNVPTSKLSDVSSIMNFNGKDIELLREMVLEARQLTSPNTKALIYGAYMHAVQDLFAHNVQQPSIFGYGNNILPDFRDNVLEIPELYYELFTQTHIPDWSFLDDVYYGWLWTHDYTDENFVGYRIPIDFELFRGYDFWANPGNPSPPLKRRSSAGWSSGKSRTRQDRRRSCCSSPTALTLSRTRAASPASLPHR